MTEKAGKSGLLGCPSEIHKLIYGYVLTFDNPIIRARPEDSSTNLALLQVSKSVEKEAAPVFYERNLFRLHYRHHLTASYNDRDLYNIIRCEEGLSPYDDAQMTCPVIDVPKRHINSLRHINLIFVPFTSASELGRKSLKIPDLEKTINFLATSNTVLNTLSITWTMKRPQSTIPSDPASSTLLHKVDSTRRISAAVGKLKNLRRLELRKSGVMLHRWPEDLSTLSGWTAVEPEAFNRVKVHHFQNAKAVLCARRAENKDISRERNGRAEAAGISEWRQSVDPVYHPLRQRYFLTDELLIDFQETGVEGRELESLSELERKRGY